MLCLLLVACQGERVDSTAAPDTGVAIDSAIGDTGCNPPSGVTGTCPDGMVYIPGGCFDRVDGRHAVVASFCLDAREVTLGAYKDCTAAGSCTPPEKTITKYPGATDEQVMIESQICNVNWTSRADHPINCVDHTQAVSYCTSRKGRLPTSDEWEWAARGRSRGSKYPWGDEAPRDQPCWAGVARRGSTCVAGSFAKDETPDGVRDLGGNVFEWSATESDATAGWFLMLGGSFGTTETKVMEIGHWYDNKPDARMNTAGFRCAK